MKIHFNKGQFIFGAEKNLYKLETMKPEMDFGLH